MYLISNKNISQGNGSLLDKLSKIIKQESQEMNDLKPGMDPEDASEVMSNRLIEVIKKRFEETKEKLEEQSSL